MDAEIRILQHSKSLHYSNIAPIHEINSSEYKENSSAASNLMPMLQLEKIPRRAKHNRLMDAKKKNNWEKMLAIENYREKRLKRKKFGLSKIIKYPQRRDLAKEKPRVGGRFIKKEK
eukprot:gene5432-9245_t